MSDHVTEWLNAYFDGELTGRRLHQVEEHLAGCEVCQAELDLLASLSGFLHEVPVPEFTSPERFATQVNLLLPQKRTPPPQPQLFEVGWWMIPVGLLAAWVFISTAILFSNMLSVADDFGLLDNTTAAWISAPSETTAVTSTLGQFGMLGDGDLQWAETTESYTRNVLPQFVWQVSVAVLYLTWFAVWWARHTRQMLREPLEG